MAKDVLGAMVTLAIIGAFLLQVTDGLASRCRAGPSPRAGPAACSGPAIAFIWYMFWGYKANGQASGTRKAVSR
jgi:hypothetical protein